MAQPPLARDPWSLRSALVSAGGGTVLPAQGQDGLEAAAFSFSTTTSIRATQEPSTMSQKPLASLIGPQDSVRVMESLKRGATRRDILTMLMAGGMQATLAGGIASTAFSAHAQTPRKGGRIRVAGATAAATDTLDPAKQSNQTDYSRG